MPEEASSEKYKQKINEQIPPKNWSKTFRSKYILAEFTNI
jgi:hypothetical protein